jgi:hypothetical protein
MALGKTLGELKQMTNAELQIWVAYVEENGPLNPTLRMEAAIARAAAPFMGPKVKAKDLMPFPRIPEPEADPQVMLAMLRSAATTNKMRKQLG